MITHATQHGLLACETMIFALWAGFRTPPVVRGLVCAMACLCLPREAEAQIAAETPAPTTHVEARAFLAETPSPARLTPGSTFVDCKDVCPTMVVIGPGHFLMGSGQYAREEPQHVVTFPVPFAVSQFDITFDEWAACVTDGGCSGNATPGDEAWGRGNRPVINVSWVDASGYTKWLSKKTSKQYGLLSEAQWEYAARAGSLTKYPWGEAIDCSKASYDGGPQSPCPAKTGRHLRGTQPVGSYAPNGWGLYDMIGNVWQWCEDSWHPDYQGAPVDGTAWLGGNETLRVLRGGAWNYGPSGLRAADRNWLAEGARANFLGFRVESPLESDIAMKSE